MPRLIVFEGPDNVGKTTLSMAVEQALRQCGHPCERLSFPGHEPNSLGTLVRDVHHGAGLATNIHPAALQLMHVAAHVDLIERRILPLLAQGTIVLLDRFWWSTAVYGRLARIPAAQIKAMLDAEAVSWQHVEPAVVFLIQRDDASVDRRIVEAYRTLAKAEQRGNVKCLDNNGDLRDSVREALNTIQLTTSIPTNTSRPTTSDDDAEESPLPLFFSRPTPAKTSRVYDTYWRFAAERQEIFFRRFHNVRPALTADPILRQHKFTNAYRASDRVSQFLIRHVIYEGEQSAEEVFFRTILFKLFNKISTWRLLNAQLGEVSWRSFSLQRVDAILTKAMADGERIYSGAYIMPTARVFGDDTRKHRTHLLLLQQMMTDGTPARIVAARSMREAFEVLRAYPMMGDFLAYQFITDLNYSSVTDFTEMEFVVPGPGARDGIRKCFEDYGGLTEADLIKLVADRQNAEFERLGLAFRSLWGRSLQLIDCQNLFCETDKYARLAHPEVNGISGRTRIKQVYRPTPEPIDYWYPPKWGINSAVSAECARHAARQD